MATTLQVIVESYELVQIEQARLYLEEHEDITQPEMATTHGLLVRVESYLIEKATTQHTLFDMNNDELYKARGMLL